MAASTAIETRSVEAPRFKTDVPLLPSAPYDRANPWLWLKNDRVKVGLNLDYGGAVCWISEPDSNFNLVNWFDPGRQIQTSYFARDGHPQEVYGGPGPEEGGAFRIWNWNPVQAGDARDGRSPVIGYHKTEDRAWVRCQALTWGGMASAVSLQGKWDPRSLATEMFMDADVSLDGPIVKITFGYTYWGRESHGICSFEMPAVYTVAPLDRFWTYTGNKPWTGAPVEEHTAKVPLDMTRKQYPFSNAEHWGAWLTSEGTGITIFQPDSTGFSAGTYYPKGAPDLAALPRDERWGKTAETHYIAGWRQIPVDQWNCRGEWDVYAIVGKLPEARELICAKLRNAATLRSAQNMTEQK